MPPCRLIAVDVGNARIKLGLFPEPCAENLPEPLQTLALDDDSPELTGIDAWLGDADDEPCCWWIASVCRPSATRLIDWLREHRPNDSIAMLSADDLPLVVRLERPDMVGIDRLVDAVAVNRLREANRPAAIVDIGSAITVDWLSTDGAFCGGAILPGMRMAARALHEFTDLLPLVEMSEMLTPPPALGTATVSAMQSGLFWGVIGAIRHLIEQLSQAASIRPQVFLTGGAGPIVADLLGPEVRHVPNLTLSGIAAAAPPDHYPRR
jgi:type III pantothenate kinase